MGNAIHISQSYLCKYNSQVSSTHRCENDHYLPIMKNNTIQLGEKLNEPLEGQILLYE
jgi:hypothetical protein